MSLCLNNRTVDQQQTHNERVINNPEEVTRKSNREINAIYLKRRIGIESLINVLYHLSKICKWKICFPLSFYILHFRLRDQNYN